jgi:hypothetical protein
MRTDKGEASAAIEGGSFDEDRAAFVRIAEAAIQSQGTADRPSAWSPAFCAARRPDQWVGVVRFENARLSYVPKRAEPSNQFRHRRPTSDLSVKGPRRLLMILESPHICEFAGPEWTDGQDPVSGPSAARVIGPAAGATGMSIRALLSEIALVGVEQLIVSPEGEDLDLVLINAIQRQTSLGHAPRYFRNEVFERAWDSERLGRRDFQSRLQKLWRAEPPDIVMNCCTGGERSRASLKRLVYDVLREMADNNPMRPPFVVGCAHPSSWQRNKNNREAKVTALLRRAEISKGVAHV